MTTEEKLDKLLADVAGLNARLDRHEESHKAVAEKLADHAHDLYGNGKPGLKSQVQAQQLICEANRAIHVKPNPLKVWCFDVSKTVAAGLIIAWAAWLLMVYKAVPATSPAATTTQVKEKAQ